MNDENCSYKQKELFYLENQLNNNRFIACGMFEVNWSLAFTVNYLIKVTNIYYKAIIFL